MMPENTKLELEFWRVLGLSKIQLQCIPFFRTMSGGGSNGGSGGGSSRRGSTWRGRVWRKDIPKVGTQRSSFDLVDWLAMGRL